MIQIFPLNEMENRKGDARAVQFALRRDNRLAITGLHLTIHETWSSAGLLSSFLKQYQLI